MAENKVKIGLEIHGYLQTREKLFCRCKAERHTTKQEIKPNTNICPICTGQPGCKPMLPNSEALKKIIQIGLMLNCKINSSFVWQRKHYDWPDLPKGFQTTISGSYSIPVGENGKFSDIGITEVHLEEDPASWNPETGCIDYNRSGLPLVEIVTEPDFSASEQVAEWLKQLILTLSYIKAVDKNAGLKADVNVSINQKAGGNRVEIKNISSIEDIRATIEYEIQRQEKEGTQLETRRWAGEKTERMRGKESSEDYRFIPEPDLPIIKLEKKKIDKIKSELPETPEIKLQKLIKKHKIDKKSAEILHKNFELVEFFEQVSEKIAPEFALSWVVIELLRVLNWNKKTLEEVDIKPEHFFELLQAVKEKKITELKAKQILNSFVPKSHSISSELKSNERITDEKKIEKFVKEVIAKNKHACEDFKAGKQESLNFLLGEVMKLSQKRADFQAAREVLIKLLKKT
jgi:aspartyl-tRNA(Asn)/glutamyl-tRNA(Gln) amidotransferase subunit B